MARGTADAWDPPEALAVAPALGPVVAVDEHGNAIVTWLQLGGAPDGGDSVEGVRLGADGIVSRASWPAGAGGMVAPSATVTPDGSKAAVAWFDVSDDNTYAATFAPAMGWDAGQAVSTGASQSRSTWGMGVSLAAGADGRVAAAWLSAGSAVDQLRILASISQP